MKTLRFCMLLLALLPVQSCLAEVELDIIKLPDGFSISVYAEGVENARQMALGESGTVFAGSRRAGKLWAISDTDNDQRADKVRLIDSDLTMPSGLEFRDGALYVGAVDRILRY